MLLEVSGLDVRYGRTHAVKSMDLILNEGEIVTVLGANGAGKSSLLKAIQGAVRPSAGEVVFNGKKLTKLNAPRHISQGLILVPEGRQIFTSLTVHENLLVGAYVRSDDVSSEIDEIYQRFSNLADRRDMPAAVLSGGEQQMLAIGRALLGRPKLLMLDEPSLGLSPRLVSELFALIGQLNKDGLSILLVEQNTHMALKTAHRGYVQELGKTVMSGTASELASEEGKLEQAYLGG